MQLEYDVTHKLIPGHEIKFPSDTEAAMVLVRYKSGIEVASRWPDDFTMTEYGRKWPHPPERERGDFPLSIRCEKIEE